LVLHGFFHDRRGLPDGSLFWTRLYSANEAEFFDLPDGFCAERLQEGAAIWNRQGWDLKGFIAPGWLMPSRQDALLARLGFSYTTRLKEIVSLQSGRSIHSQSLCYSTRSWWRRPVSRVWNRWLHGRLNGQNVIRLSMHPNDLHYESIRLQIASLVRMTLANGYQALSYADYVSR
jgi:predicted deacetylase